MTDEPLVHHPVVRALENEAIALYRAKHPDGVLWQELADSTRQMWVVHAEQRRTVAQPANTDSVPGSPLGSGARPSEQDAPGSSIGLGAEGEQ